MKFWVVTLIGAIVLSGCTTVNVYTAPEANPIVIIKKDSRDPHNPYRNRYDR